VQNRILLEISVESAERAAAAERGGADRLELCSNLAAGGLTPGRDLMQAVRGSVKIPVFAMIRPRAGDFLYTDVEFADMRQAIALAREMRMDGVVLGLLTPERHVDVPRTRQLVEAARGMQVTFHRAIDESADLLKAVDAAAEAGASRILTSGGKTTASEGAAIIAAMRERARRRLVILPGVGITSRNAAEIIRWTGAREVHAALTSVVRPDADAKTFEDEVRRLADSLATI